jgi:hypothetical protein
MFCADRICVHAVRVVTVVGLAIGGLMLMAAAQTEPTYATPTDMPLDRVADSYAIYRQVLPSNAIEWSEVKRTQWLLQDVTTAKPLSAECTAQQMTDLPKAVKAPEERKAEWDEVVADYEAHCHDRYILSSGNLALALPVRLLDKDAQKRYWSGVSGFMPPKNNIMQAPPTPEDFKGAAGLHSFSAVYFNREHTLAATYFGMGCGSLCGNWTWVVLEKTSTGWHRLPWIHVVMMS